MLTELSANTGTGLTYQHLLGHVWGVQLQETLGAKDFDYLFIPEIVV